MRHLPIHRTRTYPLGLSYSNSIYTYVPRLAKIPAYLRATQLTTQAAGGGVRSVGCRSLSRGVQSQVEHILNFPRTNLLH